MFVNSASLVCTAEVLDIDLLGRSVQVRSVETDQMGWALIAIAGDFWLQPGDQVVIAGDFSENAYVIGCLSAYPRARIATSQGASAEIKKDLNGVETLQVRNAANDVLFELDPSTGVSRLNIPQGNLEVTTPLGGISFKANGNILIEGENVNLAARSKLLLTLSHGLSSFASRLRLLPGRLHLGAQQVDVAAQHIESNSETNRTVSKQISLTSELHEVKTERISTTAETVTEHIGNIYRTVRELVQLQAGRYRAYISGLSHFRSKRAYFSSEESMNIDGDQVHIG